MSRAVFGLGPLERWLADPDVTEVLVNAGAEVWIERRGAIGRAVDAAAAPSYVGPQYAGRLDAGVLDAVLERILAPIGRRLDRSSPVVDARLPDGSRVCAVVPPVAVDGACLAIRRFGVESVPLASFASSSVTQLLAEIIGARCNVLVSGATSAGKTTLLNCLAALVGEHERVITLEDTAELRLPAAHVLRLETRPASPDGAPMVDLGTLLRTALRLRPDRLVIGEIRGAEAGDLVQALNTGHDGSLATIHANSPIDALARLESLVVQASPGWTLDAVRDQVRRSIDAVIHVRRDVTGQREIAQVCEVDHAGAGLAVRALAERSNVVASLTRRRR